MKETEVNVAVRAVLDTIADAVLVRMGARLVYMNAAARCMLGYSEDQVMDLTMLDGNESEQRRFSQEPVQMTEAQAEELKPASLLRMRRRDGTEMVVEATCSTVRFGEKTASLAIMRDLTQRRRNEKQAQLADRLASVGTLAAGIAHEINNPLAFVMANLDFLAEEFRELSARLPESRRAELTQTFDEIHMGTDRIRRVVRGLKLFSRSDEEPQSPQPLRPALEIAIQMAQNEIRHSAQLELAFDEAPLVMADESRLVQAFLNLLINSVHAIPEGAAGENRIRVALRKHGDRALVEVSDTGRALPPEVRARLFDPLSTITNVGFGTGLALSISHGIITSLGGELEIESRPDRGTVYRALLPAAVVPVVASPAPPIAPLPAAPSRPLLSIGRILVVDDDPLILSTLRRVLSREYEVKLAQSGEEALSLVAAGERFDVILSDVMMPDIAGSELHAGLLRIAPEQARQMVFMTGGAFTQSARDFLARVDSPRVDKPLDLPALRHLLRSLISR